MAEVHENATREGDDIGIRIVVAEQRDFICKALCTVLDAIPIVEYVYQATTIEEVTRRLASQPVDLLLIHQALIIDINMLPKKHFVVFTSELDTQILRACCDQQACGYILEENISESLLKLVLRSVEKEDTQVFFLDPAITLLLLNHAEANFLATSKLEQLTNREREVLYLLHNHLEDRAIAKHLSISPTTVRSYVASISHKLNLTRSEIKHIYLPYDKNIKYFDV